MGADMVAAEHQRQERMRLLNEARMVALASVAAMGLAAHSAGAWAPQRLARSRALPNPPINLARARALWGAK